MKVTAAKRVFFYGSVKLPDPGAHLSPEQVKQSFAARWPEIVNYTIHGPTPHKNELHYKFITAVQTKG